MLKSLIAIATNSLKRQAEAEPLVFEKFTVELKENMRALQLIANVVDQLLSRGMAASDVVYHALGIANTYCSRKVHVDISHTLLTLSLDRGIEREPLTIVKTITIRGPDYYTIEQVENLARQIRVNSFTIDEAEIKFDEILRQPRLYGRWVTHFAAGVLSTGVVMLFSDKPLMWLIAFLMGSSVNILLYKLARSGMPAFFSQILAGFVITMVAVAVSYISHIGNIGALEAINPTLLVISGIVLLVAGMMVVAAFQDAIDEYYVSTPLTLRDYVGSDDGSLYGITKDFREPMKTFISARTKIPNLLLTGQNLNLHGVLGVTVSGVLTSSQLVGGDYLIEKIRNA